MFTQFFGNYLLNNRYVTAPQIIEAIQAKNKTRLKLGVLAIDAGYMTAAQVEEVHQRQMFEDKRIGDLAVEMGFLTEAQVQELLNNQKTGYLLLGQALVDAGHMTNEQFEQAIANYKEKYKIQDDMEAQSDDKVVAMIEDLCDFSYDDSRIYSQYVVLLLKNLVRFVGDDFTLLDADDSVKKMPYASITQGIRGEFDSDMAIVFDDKDAMIKFGCRFSNEEFGDDEMEYIEAAACDFINIHNGLFTVNVSNERNLELTLTPPDVCNDGYGIEGEVIVFSVQYTFGVIRFIITK